MALSLPIHIQIQCLPISIHARGLILINLTVTNMAFSYHYWLYTMSIGPLHVQFVLVEIKTWFWFWWGGQKKCGGGGVKECILTFLSKVWHSSAHPYIICPYELVDCLKARDCNVNPRANTSLPPGSNPLQCLHLCQYTFLIPDCVVHTVCVVCVYPCTVHLSLTWINQL